MEDCFIVLFTRNDHTPDEEYYYHAAENAFQHFNLFLDDDSGLYEKIEVLHGDCVLKTMLF